MAANLGVAYVQIVPSMKGMSNSIAKELNNVASEKTFKNTSKGIKSSIGGAFKVAGKAGLVAMGTVSAAITGMAAKGGFTRALNIENATAKLKGLGHSTASVKSIMDSANASVKGTAFGLDAAATSAAMLSAAGIKSGKDMTASLKSVADVATISGRSMEDVGMIFASVAARGKLQGDDLLQLTSAGVPVLQMLSKHLGKTSAEVSEMVSKGQIDFATFQAAMEEGIGGAALSSGDTFTGAMANVKAALSRIGQKVATPALESLRRIFVALIPLIDAIGEALAPLIEELGTKMLAAADKAAGGIERFTAWFVALNNGGLKTFIASIPVAIMGLSQMGTAFSVLRTIKNVFFPHKKGAEEAGKAITKTAGDTEKAATRFSKLSTKISTAFKGIPGRIGATFARIPGVTGAALRSIPRIFSSTLGRLPGLFGKVFGKLPGMIGGAFGKLPGLIARFPALFSRLIPLVSRLAGVFRMLGATMMANPWMIAVAGVAALGAMLLATGGDMTVITGKIQAVSGQIVGFINNLSAQLPGIINSVVGALTGVITQVATVLPSIITTIVQTIATMLPALINAATQLLLGLVQAFTLVLPQLVQGVVQLINSLVQILPTLIPVLIQGAIALFMGLVQALTQIIAPLVQGLVQLVTTLVPVLVGLVPVLLQAAIQLFMALVQALIPIIPALINGLVNMVTTLIPALIGMIPVLLQAAIQLFMALVQALPQIIPPLIGALVNMVTTLVPALIAMIPTLLQAAVQLFMALVKALPQIVVALLGALAQMGMQIFHKIASLGPGMRTRAVQAWNALKNAFSSGITNAVNLVKSLPGRALGALGNLGGVLMDSGRSLINGFKNGIMNAFNSVKDAVKGGLSKIRNLFPFSPAKEGPFSGKGWVLYSGLSIGDAMAEGLERSSQNAIDQARELATRTRAALGDFSTQAAFNLEARAGQNAGWSGGDRQVVVNNTLKSDDPSRMMGMLARRLTGVPEVSSQIGGYVAYA